MVKERPTKWYTENEVFYYFFTQFSLSHCFHVRCKFFLLAKSWQPTRKHKQKSKCFHFTLLYLYCMYFWYCIHLGDTYLDFDEVFLSFLFLFCLPKSSFQQVDQERDAHSTLAFSCNHKFTLLYNYMCILFKRLFPYNIRYSKKISAWT